METKLRSIVKAVLWSLLGLGIMALVGAAFTGSLSTGGGIAAVNTLLGFLCYLIYERVWSGIRWGRR